MPQIKVKDFTFKLREPYGEGMEMGVAEARVLNSVRADNIRNAVFRRLDKLKGDELPTVALVEAIEQFVAQLDATYAFPTEGKSELSLRSIQLEAEKIARERAAAEAAGEGEDWIEIRASVLAKDPEIFALAAQRVEVEKATAQKALKDLLE